LRKRKIPEGIILRVFASADEVDTRQIEPASLSFDLSFTLRGKVFFRDTCSRKNNRLSYGKLYRAFI